jgi:hypothetical protein
MSPTLQPIPLMPMPTLHRRKSTSTRSISMRRPMSMSISMKRPMSMSISTKRRDTGIRRSILTIMLTNTLTSTKKVMTNINKRSLRNLRSQLKITLIMNMKMILRNKKRKQQQLRPTA